MRFRMFPALALLASGLSFSASVRAEINDWFQQNSSQQGQIVQVSALNEEMNLGSTGGCAACNGSGCSSCDGNGCGCECDSWLGCDECPQRSVVIFSGFDTFKGTPDGTFPANFGMRTGFNWGTRIGESQIGAQFGMSYGVYDWQGRIAGGENSSSQEQIFITGGFFRRADCDSRWSAGVVYDWMINDNLGSTSSEPFLGQVRTQFAYAINSCNEFGTWIAIRDRGDTQVVGNSPLIFRPVNVGNLFWHRNYECGADSYLWLGLPDHNRVSGAGGLGAVTFGALVTAPINDRWAIYSEVEYMAPSSRSGNFGGREETYNLSWGLAFYPGCNARNRTVAGNCSSPLIPVANNGTFLIDTNGAP